MVLGRPWRLLAGSLCLLLELATLLMHFLSLATGNCGRVGRFLLELETSCHALRMSEEDLDWDWGLPPMFFALASGVAPEPGPRHGAGGGDLDPHLPFPFPFPLLSFHLPLDSVLGCRGCHPFAFPLPFPFPLPWLILDSSSARISLVLHRRGACLALIFAFLQRCLSASDAHPPCTQD